MHSFRNKSVAAVAIALSFVLAFAGAASAQVTPAEAATDAAQSGYDQIVPVIVAIVPIAFGLAALMWGLKYARRSIFGNR